MKDGEFLRAEDCTKPVATVDVIAIEVRTGVIAGYPRISVVVLLRKPLPTAAVGQVKELVCSAHLSAIITVGFICCIRRGGAFIITAAVLVAAKSEKVAGSWQPGSFPVIQNFLCQRPVITI